MYRFCLERSKLCKSSSAICNLLGRLSRSRPELCNSSTSALCQPSVLYPSSGTLYPSSSVLRPTMRKCQTLVSLSSPESPPRPLPIHPYNRLRPQKSTTLLCSRYGFRTIRYRCYPIENYFFFISFDRCINIDFL